MEPITVVFELPDELSEATSVSFGEVVAVVFRDRAGRACVDLPAEAGDGHGWRRRPDVALQLDELVAEKKESETPNGEQVDGADSQPPSTPPIPEASVEPVRVDREPDGPAADQPATSDDDDDNDDAELTSTFDVKTDVAAEPAAESAPAAGLIDKVSSRFGRARRR
jgi:hypothetical protein